jgi:predicted MFS family arabinose efflux permease
LVIFTISQIFNPAELAAITHIVNKRELILANSLFMGTWMLASILSFGVAVPITYNYGIITTFGVTALLYISAASLIALLRFKEESPHAHKGEFKSIRRQLRTGIRFVLRHRIVFYSMFQMGFGISLLAILSAVSINFVDAVLQRPDSDFGYLVALAGIGMGVGIALISRMVMIFKKLSIVLIGFAIAGIMLLFLSFTRNITQAFIIVFFMGIGNAFITAPIQTIIQEHTPKTIRGKVFSIQNLIASFAFTIPPLLAGFITDLYGHSVVFFGMGLCSLLFILNIRKLQK